MRTRLGTDPLHFPSFVEVILSRFESDEEEKRRLTNVDDNDDYEPKRKKTRISAKDDGDDRQYYTRLKEFYANKKPPCHSNDTGEEEMEVGQGLWMPLTIWNRLFK